MLVRPFLFSGELAGKPVDRNLKMACRCWAAALASRAWHLGQGAPVASRLGPHSCNTCGTPGVAHHLAQKAVDVAHPGSGSTNPGTPCLSKAP